MKRIFYLLLLSGILATSCTGQSGSKDSDTSKGNSDAVKEDVQAATGTNVYADAPVHLTKADFLEKVMNYELNRETWVYEGSLPSIVDFYADWCAPCRITSPILDDLAKEYAGQIVVYKVDVQKERELASTFGIQGIPAFLLIPLEGQPQMFSGIARTPEETKEMFVQYIENVLLEKTAENL